MRRDSWYYLTQEELDRLNPPVNVEDIDDWLPVGYIPRPASRVGWFIYHLVHGLWMRYPWYKVVGYALANTKPDSITVNMVAIEMSDEDRQFLSAVDQLAQEIYGAQNRKDSHDCRTDSKTVVPSAGH